MKEQVRQELVELERAGYNPQGPQENYPTDIIAASAQRASQAVGGMPSGTSMSGQR
ncbi:DUF4148 domain-containing protein [Paraburkholderia sp. UYCP14C]|uniref:DUF4148 domain-containing protein n=1 Tax=Paraburkholderia sp. UYCP14C TaxID=2511130 RepID=UPI0020071653|nr:DUF4148 domain-containing protein [Paraburkholderia sp. UYCP14C]